MTATKTLLIEIGTEELPAQYLQSLSEQLQKNLLAQLNNAEINHGAVTAYATPRRLAVLINDVLAQQPDRTITKRGPALNAAYNADGDPTPAALGFARSCDIAFAELQTMKTDKGAWLYHEALMPGEATIQLLPQLIQQAFNAFTLKKPMHWQAEPNNANLFLRPVRWLTILWDADIIPVTAWGVTSSNKTRGHRFMGNEKAIVLTHAAEYNEILEKNFVVANYAERQKRIRLQLAALEKQHQCVITQREDLLDEVTGLVEWPVALLGNFEATFLSVPKEVIMTTLQQHQRCFAVTDQHGKLLPHFVTISNLQSKDPSAVIRGNERVVRARLSDAYFFYQQDSETPVEKWLEKLGKMTFQEGLGSLDMKAKRISELAKKMANDLGLAADQITLAERAGKLCKTDLASGVVGEFPELQGIMGGYYAALQGEAPEIATAIKEHYLPRFATDILPQSVLGQILAIADKLDTLVGIIALKGQPSADKDPFGLRRAALGILRVLLDAEWCINLLFWIRATIEAYGQFSAEVANNVMVFFADRFWHYCKDQGFASEMINSVLEHSTENGYFIPDDCHARLHALQQFMSLAHAADLIAVNKRVSNILQKNKITQTIAEPSTTLFVDASEHALWQKTQEVSAKLNTILQQQNYADALTLLSELQAPLATFFEVVMVEDPDNKIKQNRLSLLFFVQQQLRKVAHLEHLQGLLA